jgi:two-component sensor histidine kinase
VKYLLALLLLLAFTGQAEPLYPFLSQTKADSLRKKLWQTPPSISRVNLLVQLGFDLAAKEYSTDSTVAFIHQAQALSKTLGFTGGQIDSEYAWAYFLYCDWKNEEAGKVILQALARSQEQHDRYREAVGYFFLSITLGSSQGNQLERIQYCERAIQLFQALHNPMMEARCLKEVADAHLILKKPALAQQELRRVLTLYRSIGYRNLHYTFDLLAATDKTVGNYKSALQYGLAAVQSAYDCQDTTQLYAFCGRVANLYQELNQREKTIHYLRIALRNTEAKHYQHETLDFTIAIANQLIALQRPQQALALMLQKSRAMTSTSDDCLFLAAEGLAICYLATKQYALAGVQCTRLAALLKTKINSESQQRQQKGHYTLGKYYLATQQYAKARAQLTESLAISEQLGNRGGMATDCLLLFKVDSAQGNLPSAIAYYQRYKVLNDSIFNEKNSKQIAGLQIQYDTEKREQSIALLTKRNLVQQMTIRQREFQRNAILGGAGLLILVLGLGYNRYRLKQRSSRLLEQKQHALEAQQAEIHRKNQALEQVLGEKDQLLEERQELLVEKDWMLKEIHHRVKNNLQVVSSLLATQSRHLHDPQALAAIRESQNRVQVMALLHQKLYQADNIGRVNMADYGREIVTYLVQSFDRQHAVQTKLELAPIELETTLATPLGLIINEAVTNALKHAFPPPQRGTLTVSLVCLAPQQYELSISDDGVGLSAGFDLTRSRSLGMVIIKGLSRQLDGQLAVSMAEGVHLSLQFNTSKKPVHAEEVA